MATAASTYINQTSDRQGQRYLIFSVADEHYAVAVLKVSEIIQVQPITRIARLPSYIKGVINLRGKVIPVVDLRIKFDFPEQEYTDRTCIVVVYIRGDDGRDFLTGLVVDGVEEVVHLRNDDIVEAHNFGHSFLAADYIFGVVRMEEQIATVLDIDRVVNDETLKQVDEAADEARSSPDDREEVDTDASPAESRSS